MAVEVDRPETPTRAGGSLVEGGVGEVRMRAELSPPRFACQGGPLRAPPAELMADRAIIDPVCPFLTALGSWQR
jgi:hypothetical protein